MVSAADATAIDTWRHTNRIGSRAEAIRQLIERGMKDGALTDEVPLPVRAKGSPGTPASLDNARPYPAEKIAKASAASVKALNVDLPERLKIQLGWVAEARQMSLTKLVTELLQRGIDDQLKPLGIKP